MFTAIARGDARAYDHQGRLGIAHSATLASARDATLAVRSARMWQLAVRNVASGLLVVTGRRAAHSFHLQDSARLERFARVALHLQLRRSLIK